MIIKTTNRFFLVLLLLLMGCKSRIATLTIDKTEIACDVLQFSPDYKEYVFYNWYKPNYNVCEINSFPLKNDFGYKSGYTKDGLQHGKWKSNRYYYKDSIGHKVLTNYIFREEYFKKGLRNSIYKIYDKNGKIIYSTYFKNGSGLEKDFHENGKLYYEVATQNGYLTDTVKLYNNKGRMIEKLFYEKDSLIFHYKSTDGFLDTIEDGKKVRFIYVDDKELKSTIGQKIFKNEIWTYKYGKIFIKKKDTIIDGEQVIFEDDIEENEVIRTVYKKKNSKRQFESIYHYSNDDILKSKIVVTNSETINPIETKTIYNDKGEIISICKREFMLNYALKNNQNNEITDYYKNGKKYQWSKLVCTASKVNNDIGELGLVKSEELYYYNLKSELIKKEYLRDISYLYRDSDNRVNVEIIQKIELLKTEFYKGGKLIKTLVNDKDK